MAENIRNIKLRLNLDKPEARRANEILSSCGGSMSQFIIAAVNAYGSYLDEEEAKCCLGREPRTRPPDVFWELLEELYTITALLPMPEQQRLSGLILRLQEAV